MISSYSAKKYLEYKKAHQAARDKYKEAEKELHEAQKQWWKIRDAIRAALPEANLDEAVIKVLQEEIEVK